METVRSVKCRLELGRCNWLWLQLKGNDHACYFLTWEYCFTCVLWKHSSLQRLLRLCCWKLVCHWSALVLLLPFSDLETCHQWSNSSANIWCMLVCLSVHLSNSAPMQSTTKIPNIPEDHNEGRLLVKIQTQVVWCDINFEPTLTTTIIIRLVTNKLLSKLCLKYWYCEATRVYCILHLLLFVVVYC